MPDPNQNAPERDPNEIAKPHEIAMGNANVHPAPPELDEMTKQKIDSQSDELLMRAFKVVEKADLSPARRFPRPRSE